MLALVALIASGCAGGDGGPASSRTGTGAAIGATLGGIAGAVLDDNDLRGPILGAAAGAALGGGIGYLLDRQQQELEAALGPERAMQAAAVEQVEGERLRVTIDEEAAFDEGSTAIRPSFLPTLERVADVLERYDDTQVLVVYHAGTGDAALSEARAAAVGDALATYGIDPSRVRAEGRTPSGARVEEARSRRVEILVTPTA